MREPRPGLRTRPLPRPETAQKAMRYNTPRRGKTAVGDSTFEWGARTYVMGVLNVTPDSFSGDGVGGDLDAAVRRALDFQEAGADVIDVGGESTRPASIYPGAAPISAAEELARVLPVIEALADVLDIPVSIDTHKAEVRPARRGRRRRHDQRPVGARPRPGDRHASRPRPECPSC